MKNRKTISTLIILLLCSFTSMSQTERIYVNNDNGDTITLFSDMKIKFYFHPNDFNCYAIYKEESKNIEVNFNYFNIKIDTLNKKCKGFYIEGADVALYYDTIISEVNNIDFIPFEFSQDSDSIGFVFTETYHDDINGFKLNKMTAGCYKLIIEFNSCLFFQTSTKNKILKLRCRGRKLIMGDYKYYRIDIGRIPV